MKKQIKIIRENNPNDMEIKVNEFLNNGWKIKDGLQVYDNNYHLMLYKELQNGVEPKTSED